MTWVHWYSTRQVSLPRSHFLAPHLLAPSVPSRSGGGDVLRRCRQAGDFSDHLCRAFGHGAVDVQVGAGAEDLGSADADEYALRLESRGNFGGRSEFGVDVEPDEVGVDFGRIQTQSVGLADGLCDQLGVLMIFAEATDVVFDGEECAGGG